MNDLQQHDNWDDEKVEIVDLPEQGESKAADHKSIGLLQHQLRIPTLIWAVRIGIVLLVGLLVLTILLQTPFFSSPRNSSRPASKPAPLTVTGMSVLNGFVYVNASDGSIAAYRSNDGKRLWRVNLGARIYYAITSDQTVYCFLIKGDYGQVAALRASDGTLLWTHQDTFTGVVWLMAKDGIVYLNTERGMIYALRSSDGRLLWHFLAGMPMQFSGFMSVNNGIVAIQTYENELYLLRERDGAVIYHYASLLTLQDVAFPYVDKGFIAIISNTGSVQVRNEKNGSLVWQYTSAKKAAPWLPTVLDGIAYVNNAAGSIQALRIQNGSQLWQFKPGAAISLPVLDNRTIYMTTAGGTVVALRSADGTLLWHTQFASSVVNETSYPTVDGGTIYLNLNQPGGNVLALSAGDGHVLWQRALSTHAFAHAPLVSNGIIYLGTDDLTIDAWRGSDGQFLWHYRAPTQIIWYPTVVDGIMYVLPYNGTLDVLRLSDGKLLWQFAAQK